LLASSSTEELVSKKLVQFVRRLFEEKKGEGKNRWKGNDGGSWENSTEVTFNGPRTNVLGGRLRGNGRKEKSEKKRERISGVVGRTKMNKLTRENRAGQKAYMRPKKSARRWETSGTFAPVMTDQSVHTALNQEPQRKIRFGREASELISGKHGR